MSVDSGDMKIVKKRFWIWQAEMEEAWLSDMASKGWHFASLNGVTNYCFIKGKPEKVRYCLDYQSMAKDKENYMNIFKDSGWEYIGNMGNWQYFRKEYDGDELPEIFTDNESKLQRYYRLLGLSSIFLMLSPLVILILTGSIGSIGENLPDFLKGFLTGVSIGAILAFVFFTSVILGKINQLKKEQ